MTAKSTCAAFGAQQHRWVAGDLAAPPVQTDAPCDTCAEHARAAAEIAAGLDALAPAAPGLDAARAALAAALAAARAPLYLDTLESPVGPLLLAASDRGLRAIHYLARGESGLTAHGVPAPERLAPVRAQLADYFAGRRTAFDLPLDLQGVGPFGERVLRATAQIPFGRVSSYGELARALGAPGAARAVGNALNRNPLPIVIPCHRILRGDGSLGGYAGTPPVKRRLLALEGVHPAA